IDESASLASRLVLNPDDGRPVPPRPLLHLGGVVLGEQRVVDPVPLRALPARRFQKVRPERPLARVEGARPQRTWLLHGVLGMDDVVDLLEGLRTAGQHVGGALLEVVEAVDIQPARVDARGAVRHPLGYHPGRARRVRNPYGLRHPEAAHLPRLAEQRSTVRREREQSVYASLYLGLLQRKKQPARLFPWPLEVLRGELHDRGHLPPGLVLPRDLVRRDWHRAVLVGADPVTLADLPEVHRVVLVPKDDMV